MSSSTALIVDDSPEIRRLLSRSLASLNFTIIEAANGEEAVRLARECCPAVVVLDLCMPSMDGWEVVRHMRSDPALEEVPIIVITAYYGSTTIQSAQRAGCQYVVAKPFELREIVRMITMVTSRSNTQLPRYA